MQRDQHMVQKAYVNNRKCFNYDWYKDIHMKLYLTWERIWFPVVSLEKIFESNMFLWNNHEEKRNDLYM